MTLYATQIATLIFIYAILAKGLDVATGHTGMFSLAQGAFYGVGAYTSALLVAELGVPFLVGVAAGMVVAILMSLLVSLSTFRMGRDHFVIATFAFQVILFGVLNNWVSLTHGPLGIPGIPQPLLFGWQVTTDVEFLALAAFFATIAHLLVYRLTSSPFGRVLHAIREDEDLVKALGKGTFYFKAIAFAVSAALAAMAGSLYAHYISYIDPTNFTIMESILVISMVIIGGAGSAWGPLLGAIVLVVLPESLRFIGLSTAIGANVRQIIYGVLLVIMVLFRPRGLVGKYGFSK